MQNRTKGSSLIVQDHRLPLAEPLVPQTGPSVELDSVVYLREFIE
ncbi:MAG: hypothetical protein QGI09_02260 [Dehalococcoidia bacterium]|nr:hypothetical protein [Dehalococcoidia bacterium]